MLKSKNPRKCKESGVKMSIPLWSDTNPKVKEVLLPAEPIDRDDLTEDEKKSMAIY